MPITDTITSKTLHEETAHCLDRVKRGESLRIVREGEAAALLTTPEAALDPTWDEIMGEVRQRRSQPGPVHPNPVLAERQARDYATRLR